MPYPTLLYIVVLLGWSIAVAIGIRAGEGSMILVLGTLGGCFLAAAIYYFGNLEEGA